MHAQGNDFIITDEKVNITKRLVTLLCNRHFGIGADGLVLLSPSQKADIKMQIYNADGSKAEICGSALRCSAFLMAKNKKSVKIETDVGIKFAEIEDNFIEVEIGKPEFVSDEKIKIGDLHGYYISVGNPHFVVFVNDLDSVEKYVKSISTNKIFKEGINIEFVKITARDKVEVRVFERGVGETLACGTGASAVLFAGFKNKMLSNKIKIKFPGGDVFTRIENDSVYLSGEVKLVFKGEIEL